MTTKLTIGKLATAADVGVDTVRYYERIGLMPSPARSMGGYRLYGRDDLERLRFIRSAQQLGFSLSEIERLLTWIAEDGDRACVRQLASQRLTEIDRQLADLKAHRDTLTNLIDACPGHGPLADCPIIEAVVHPHPREQKS
jgi:MerR family transcriptional regulator, copper efflux regulator